MPPPKVAKKMKGTAKAVVKNIIPFLDRQFNLLVSLMSLWMMFTWFGPLIVDQAASALWYEKTNVFINMRHLKKFLLMTDTVFVISIVIAILMLLLSVIITAVYMFSMCKYGNAKHVSHKVFIHKPWFRSICLCLLTCFMVVVSTAGILDMVCINNADIRHDAMTLKHLSHKNADIVEFKEYGVEALSMAMGEHVTASKYGSLPGAGIILGTGLLVRGRKGCSLMNIDGAHSYYSGSKLYYNGMMVVNKTNYDDIMNMGLHEYDHENGNLNLFTIDEKPVYKFESNITDARKMAALKVTKEDITVDTVVGYILKKQGVKDPSSTQMLTLATNPNLKAAVAAARLICMQNSVAMYAMYAGNADELNLDTIIDSAHTCGGGTVYSTTIFLLSFVFGMITKLVFLMYKYVYLRYYKKKSKANYKYDPVKMADAYEDWSNDELETDNTEEDADEWTTVGPLSNVSNPPL